MRFYGVGFSAGWRARGRPARQPARFIDRNLATCFAPNAEVGLRGRACSADSTPCWMTATGSPASHTACSAPALPRSAIQAQGGAEALARAGALAATLAAGVESAPPPRRAPRAPSTVHTGRPLVASASARPRSDRCHHASRGGRRSGALRRIPLVDRLDTPWVEPLDLGEPAVIPGCNGRVLRRPQGAIASRRGSQPLTGQK